MDAFYSTTVLGFSLYEIGWAFVLYSFLGVVVEMVFCLVLEGVVESRLGLLYLPLRPMYGIGGVACMVLLSPVLQQPVLVFVLGLLICTVVEFVGSAVMEKGFGAVFWDYSDKPLHLQGRVCLQYSLAWGLLALLPAYAGGLLSRALAGVGHRKVGEVLLTGVLVLVLLSWTLTLAAFARLRTRVGRLRVPADGGPAPAAVAATGWGRMVDGVAPVSVMALTFPHANLLTELTALTGDRHER